MSMLLTRAHGGGGGKGEGSGVVGGWMGG